MNSKIHQKAIAKDVEIKKCRFLSKQNLFLCKTLHPWKARGCPIKPNPPLNKKELKESDLHGNVNFYK